MKISHFLFVILIGAIAYATLSSDFHRAVARLSSGILERHGSTLNRPGQVPMAVSRLATEKGESIEEALVHFNNTIATAPRFLVEGHVIDRLPAGHLLIAGIVSTEGGTVVEKQTVALYGHPQAASIGTGALISCRVCMAGMQHFAKKGGPQTMFEELIYVGENVPGNWMTKPDRTSLDRKH